MEPFPTGVANLCSFILAGILVGLGERERERGDLERDRQPSRDMTFALRRPPGGDIVLSPTGGGGEE